MMGRQGGDQSQLFYLFNLDELFVGISVEGQRAVIGVKHHFQHACLGTGQSSIGKTVRDKRQDGSDALRKRSNEITDDAAFSANLPDNPSSRRICTICNERLVPWRVKIVARSKRVRENGMGLAKIDCGSTAKGRN